MCFAGANKTEPREDTGPWNDLACAACSRPGADWGLLFIPRKGELPVTDLLCPTCADWGFRAAMKFRWRIPITTMDAFRVVD